MTKDEPSVSPVEIHLLSGRSLKLTAPVDAGWLHTLVRVLESPCGQVRAIASGSRQRPWICVWVLMAWRPGCRGYWQRILFAVMLLFFATAAAID